MNGGMSDREVLFREQLSSFYYRGNIFTKVIHHFLNFLISCYLGRGPPALFWWASVPRPMMDSRRGAAIVIHGNATFLKRTSCFSGAETREDVALACVL